ncbi:hypothetical protein CHU92_05185 [Flavobacterium cyanobacteriorum]|uniref:EF-hand domain-containing protein n=1 Tax=Flavobacterium cyanobacteriorum TaxID=2022802 RepID=A0A255ZAB7_9FLAO|nr:hypothetical protein [Flavobacterium cyanobacteriorum]OYQ38399.1 hypothetical protein CHU92_05185 [Flavobacterium cyanobacteriorum]
MRKAILALLAVVSTGIFSCREEGEKPKVRYEAPKSSGSSAAANDTTDIKVADLPILMEGTKYLIHPVGDIRVYDTSNKIYGSSRTNSSVSYAISNYNQYEITGYFENLKFQHIDSTSLRPLTNTKLQIQTATYLNTIATRLKKQLLVYTLVDSDTNRDGKIDANDIRSLYISDISGNGFKKLSSDMQELIDWNIIETQNRLYFRTIEDINKNGAFDKNDLVHYHFADLSSPDWNVSVYEPVK